MEGEAIRLVVGLGNPGERYAGTRHNVGFIAVERFVASLEGAWSAARPGAGRQAKVRLPGGRELWVVQPHTFMNVSGEMVAAFARYYKIAPPAVLVVADDFSLPLGKIRVRRQGSSGGQKGLESILRQFGTQEVPRVRLGIGPVPPHYNPADFVLGRFRKDESDCCAEQMRRAADAIRACCEKDVGAAMNSFNGGEK
ncbi:MAG: aminoacyl-tRNA hydrolase [Elusimicrobiota bacterium]